MNLWIFYRLCLKWQFHLLKDLVSYTQATFQHSTTFGWRYIAFWIWCLQRNSDWSKWPKTFCGRCKSFWNENNVPQSIGKPRVFFTNTGVEFHNEYTEMCISTLSSHKTCDGNSIDFPCVFLLTTMATNDSTAILFVLCINYSFPVCCFQRFKCQRIRICVGTALLTNAGQTTRKTTLLSLQTMACLLFGTILWREPTWAYCQFDHYK